MTPFLWVMAGVSVLIVLAQVALLAYTIHALLNGRRSVSGYLKNAPRWVVALVGFVAGTILGALFSHWWFPTVGG